MEGWGVMEKGMWMVMLKLECEVMEGKGDLEMEEGEYVGGMEWEGERVEVRGRMGGKEKKGRVVWVVEKRGRGMGGVREVGVMVKEKEKE